MNKLSKFKFLQLVVIPKYNQIQKIVIDRPLIKWLLKVLFSTKDILWWILRKLIQLQSNNNFKICVSKVRAWLYRLQFYTSVGLKYGKNETQTVDVRLPVRCWFVFSILMFLLTKHSVLIVAFKILWAYDWPNTNRNNHICFHLSLKCIPWE